MRKLILPVLGLALVALTVWQVRRGEAIAGPELASRVEAPRARAEARVVSARGAQVVVGVERGGLVARMTVTEGQVVQKGDVIAELDASEDEAALAEAKARAAQAEADVRFAEVQLERARRLVAESAGAADSADRALHDRDVALAQRDLARATVKRLAAGVAKSRILAPIGGTVLQQHAQAGEVLAPGARLATIADLSQTRIEAEVDEFDIGRVRQGDAVRISAEGFEQGWKGRIVEVPAHVERRSLRRQDPGMPNDTGVLRVQIEPLETLPLKLGQRADVEVIAADAAAEPVAVR